MPDNRRSDSFVGEDKLNGPIAAVEFEDGPHRSTHLLALHVGGISGNTQSAESDQGRDDCVISAGATRLRLFRHGADLIGGWVYVNYPRRFASPCSSGRRFAHNRRERSKPKSKLTFDLFVSFCSKSKLPSPVFDQLLALCISQSALAFQPQLANDRRTTGRTVLSRYRKHRVPKT